MKNNNYELFNKYHQRTQYENSNQRIVLMSYILEPKWKEARQKSKQYYKHKIGCIQSRDSFLCSVKITAHLFLFGKLTPLPKFS